MRDCASGAKYRKRRRQPTVLEAGDLLRGKRGEGLGPIQQGGACARDSPDFCAAVASEKGTPNMFLLFQGMGCSVWRKQQRWVPRAALQGTESV